MMNKTNSQTHQNKTNLYTSLLNLVGKRRAEQITMEYFVERVTASILDFSTENGFDPIIDKEILEYSGDLDGIPELRNHKDMSIDQEEQLLISNIEKLAEENTKKPIETK